jgi:hypothetical protein
MVIQVRGLEEVRGKKVIPLAVTPSPEKAIRLEIKKERALTYQLIWMMFSNSWKKNLNCPS